MKLHLPGKLRAALLATFAFVSLAPASAATAEFGYGYSVQATSRNQENFSNFSNPIPNAFFSLYTGTNGALENHSSIISYDSFDVNNSNWTLTLSSSYFAQYTDMPAPNQGQSNSHWSSIASTWDLFFNASETNFSKVDNSNSWYYKDADWIDDVESGDFSLAITPKGKLKFYSKLKEVTLASLCEEGFWNSTSFDFKFQWDAEAKTFTLMPSTIANSEGELIQLEEKVLIDAEDEWVWREGLFTYNASEDWSYLGNGGIVVLAGTGSNITYSLTAPDTNLQAWLVSGTSYMGSSYEDTINGGSKVMNLSSTEGSPADKMQFIGVNGVVMTDKDAVFDAEFSVAPDLSSNSGAVAVGFGAETGTTLTVKTAYQLFDVPEAPALAEEGGEGTPDDTLPEEPITPAAPAPKGTTYGMIATLNITGGGTVQLDMGTENSADFSSGTISILNGTTLEIISDDDTIVNIARGTISSSSDIVRTAATDEEAKKLVLITGNGSTGANVVMDSVRNAAGEVWVTGNREYNGTQGSLIVNSLEASGIYVSSNLGVLSDVSIGSVIVGSGSMGVQGNLTADSLTMYSGAELGVSGDLTINANTSSIADATILGSTKVGSPTLGTLTIVGDVSVADITTGHILLSEWYDNAALSSTGDITVNSITMGALDITLTRNADSTETGALLSGSSSAPTVVSNSLFRATDVKDLDVIAGAAIGGPAIASNVSTKGTLIIDNAHIAADELTADTINLPDGYELSAAKVQVTGDIATVSGSTYSNATMEKLVGLSDTAATVATLKADSVNLANGYALNGAYVDVDNLSLGNNVSLNGVSLSSSTQVTVAEATRGATETIQPDAGPAYQVQVPDSERGGVNLNNVTMAAGYTGFGKTAAGNDGITIAPMGTATDSVSITGTFINGNAQDGDKLAVESIIVNSDVEFVHGDVVDFVVLEQTEGTKIDYDPNVTNYQLNIQSYVRGELSLDPVTGNIVFTGTEDEAGIVDELMSNENRAVTITAMQDAGGSAVGGVMGALYEKVGHVNRYSETERTTLLDALSGASLAILGDSQRRGVQDTQRNLRNRIIQMGGGEPVGILEDINFAGVQAWVQADGGFNKVNDESERPGYDYDAWGATVGANLDLTPNWTAGAAISVSYGDLTANSKDYAKGNNDAKYLSLFARHQSKRWVQLFILTGGMNDMELNRRVDAYSSTASVDGSTLSGYYELGYTFALDEEFTQIIQPIVSISLTKASVDGFSETGSIGNAGLDCAGDDYIYGTLSAGARYQAVLGTNEFERNSVLELRATLSADFGDATNEANVSFIGGGPVHTVKCAEVGSFGAELGAGLSVPVGAYTTVFADADLTLRTEYTGVRANIGLRYDF